LKRNRGRVDQGRLIGCVGLWVVHIGSRVLAAEENFISGNGRRREGGIAALLQMQQ